MHRERSDKNSNQKGKNWPIFDQNDQKFDLFGLLCPYPQLKEYLWQKKTRK